MQDPQYTVTFYYNTRTGASVYDPPPEFLDWERQYATWMRRA